MSLLSPAQLTADRVLTQPNDSALGGGDWFAQNAPQAQAGGYPGASSGGALGQGGGIASQMTLDMRKAGLDPQNAADVAKFQQQNPQYQYPTANAGGQAGGDWISQSLQAANSTDDPNYWRKVIAEDPKVAAGDQSAIDYWKMRIAQGDGAQATRSGQQQPYGSSGIQPGSFLQPYSGQFSLPSAADLQNMPGFQSMLDAGRRASERSAAANGTLLTRGHQEDLQSQAIGTAMQQYGNLANLSLGVQEGNYGIFRNNQNDPYQKLFNLSQLGQNAANQTGSFGSSYGTAGTGSLGDVGNANSAGSVSQGSIWGRQINGLGGAGTPQTARIPGTLGGPVYDRNGVEVGRY